jgi:hypothetical protein
MLQHGRSIYAAKIGRILRSVNGSIRIMSYFNGLGGTFVAGKLPHAAVMLQQRPQHEFRGGK